MIHASTRSRIRAGQPGIEREMIHLALKRVMAIGRDQDEHAARRESAHRPVDNRTPTQHPQYEIDREVMRINETHDRLRVGSISDAKYALAARNTSLTRRSSAFSRASRRFSSSIAVVGRSSRSPASASA
jgi:hypothetical protein